MTNNDIHDLTGVTTPNDFYDNYDLTKPYNIFGVLTLTHACYDHYDSEHFSLSLS